jgi:hypothetical protein
LSVSDAALEGLADALLPKLLARGVMLEPNASSAPAATPPQPSLSPEYDAATCKAFVKREHLGDRVLLRAEVFFGLLDQHGEVSSPDLVAALGLKGARSVPANLTNSLKKRARKLGVGRPWRETATPDGLRTIWRDRDGIAHRMVHAIEVERRHRGL